ncbi:hypothetical protein OMW55_05470 [Sphingomonas sp. BN140010]|uniref:Uncharacterized protein n=1 Tax=Sphingomonas arvum TaxID=2992113 RepID=A0ABT3JDW2_9SPHN|nr:hypothetical protein [Sphingomonas sp. BN140010]MCW3797256.1 hypothetical protein [Sphingomonas sp. BN140010]
MREPRLSMPVGSTYQEDTGMAQKAAGGQGSGVTEKGGTATGAGGRGGGGKGGSGSGNSKKTGKGG